MDRLADLLTSDPLRRTLPIGLTLFALYHLLRPTHPNWTVPNILPSPLSHVSSLPPPSLATLPYPPTSLPGARTLSTPYGSIRIYEFGPGDGPRILLIHGISTPCISLAGVAKELAANGYRVMLFDLFGRGYSDTPDPRTNPQNMQLWTTQILLALTSSEVNWTGERKFSIVGYSLGGGIAAGFAAWFPQMVEGLVLVAPSGLLRAGRIARSSRVLYSGLVPRGLVHWLVGRRLGGGAAPTEKGAKEGNPEATPAEAVVAEVPSGEGGEHPALMPDSQAPLFEDRPGISVADAVRWQLEKHEGFLPAFVSSIQHAPISEQHESWRKIARQKDSLKGGKVLMALGTEDGVIVRDEVEEDARECLGADGLEVRTVEAGHDLPIVKAKEVVAHIIDFWGS